MWEVATAIQGGTVGMAPSAPAEIIWNPGRYYGGLDQVAGVQPTSSTIGTQAYFQQLFAPMLVIVIALWLLERRRQGVKFRAAASAGVA